MAVIQPGGIKAVVAALPKIGPKLVRTVSKVTANVLGHSDVVSITARKGASRLVNPAIAVLTQTKQMTRQGKMATIIFDLDDTLFRAAPRTQRILGEWAKTPAGKPFANGIAKLKQADIGYEMEAVYEKAGIPKALHAEVGKFHIDRFFANEYLKFDRVIPGGAELTKKLHASGGKIVYVTGRWEELRPGTMAALKKAGFPTGTRTALFMKQGEGSTSAFKGQVAEKLKTNHKIVGTFDNEAANTNIFQEKLPKAINVWIKTSQPITSPSLVNGTYKIHRYPVTSTAARGQIFPLIPASLVGRGIAGKVVAS